MCKSTSAENLVSLDTSSQMIIHHKSLHVYQNLEVWKIFTVYQRYKVEESVTLKTPKTQRTPKRSFTVRSVHGHKVYRNSHHYNNNG